MRQESIVQGSNEGLTAENAASYNKDQVSKPQVIYDQSWQTSLARPLLILAMVGCVAWVLASLIQRIAEPASPLVWGTLIVLGLLSALLGVITSSILSQPQNRMQQTTGYRVAEFLCLVVLARLALWLATGSLPTPAQLLLRPIDSLIDGWFFAGLILVLLCWGIAMELVNDTQKLALQADELYAAQHHYDRLGEIARTSSTDRSQILAGIVARWSSVGLLMVFFAALIRRELPGSGNVAGAFAVLRQQIEPGVSAAILFYFIGGLLLIGLGHLAMLRARWTLEKIPSHSSILRNWPLYIVGFVGLVALVASLMPLGDTFLLAQMLNTVISFIFMVLYTITQFFLGLFLWMMGALFGGEQAAPTMQAPAAQPMQLPTPTPTAPTLPPWTGGAIFWLIMFFLLGNALLIYFGGRRLNWAWLTWLWNALLERFRQLFGAVQQWRTVSSVNEAWQRITGQTEADNFDAPIDLTRLTPQQQARYFYLSTLAAAQKAGTPRNQSETPRRYAPRLAAAIDQSEEGIDKPEASATSEHPLDERKEEIDALTQTFIHVRYAGASVTQESLAGLRRAWTHLQGLLVKKSS